MKYVDAKVVFAEIPNEITLAINISGCPVRCPDCHSKYLWEDIGESLDRDSLHSLIESNKGITCLAFMGGDADVSYLQSLFSYVKTNYPYLKIAWYSGIDRVLPRINTRYLDYIKVGPYIKSKGPLNERNTNQRMYKIHRTSEGATLLMNMTSKFWK